MEFVPSVFSLSFPKRSASMLLTRKNEEAGRQAKSGVGWVESHRGLLGSRGRRARLRMGEAVRALGSNGTNEGGGAVAVKSSPGGAAPEAPPPQGSPPAPPARVGSLPKQTPTQKPGLSRRGVDPAQTPTGGLKQCRIGCPGRRPPGALSARARRNPHHTGWRCEGRKNECRRGTTKDLPASAERKKKKKVRTQEMATAHLKSAFLKSNR